jgi:hypothetical protein
LQKNLPLQRNGLKNMAVNKTKEKEKEIMDEMTFIDKIRKL